MEGTGTEEDGAELFQEAHQHLESDSQAQKPGEESLSVQQQDHGVQDPAGGRQQGNGAVQDPAGPSKGGSVEQKGGEKEGDRPEGQGQTGKDLELGTHRRRGKAVRCVIYLNGLQGQSCVRIFSCSDPIEKLLRAINIWLVGKPGVTLINDKPSNYKLYYKDPYEQPTLVSNPLRELVLEDDWDAALADLQLVSSLQQGKQAESASSPVVRLEVVVMTAPSVPSTFTTSLMPTVPGHPLASILPPGTGISPLPVPYTPVPFSPQPIPCGQPASTALVVLPMKRGRGRPKGSKTKPKLMDPDAEAAWEASKKLQLQVMQSQADQQFTSQPSSSSQHLLSLQQVYRMFAKRGQAETADTLPRAGLLLERMSKKHIRAFCELKYQLHHVLKRDGEDIEHSRGADYIVSLQRMACPLCGKIFAANDTQFANLWGARKPGGENKHLDFHLKQEISEVERLGAERVIQRLWDWKHNNGIMTAPGPPALAAPPKPDARPDFIMPSQIIPGLADSENASCVWNHKVIEQLERSNPRVLKGRVEYQEVGQLPRPMLLGYE